MTTGRKKIIGAMAILALTMPLSARGSGKGPDTVELESLVQHYAPVSFNHAAHVDIAQDCAVCHHHTTGAAPTDKNCLRCHAKSGAAAVVACKDCHPAERFGAEYMAQLESDPTIYHVGKPGLKGAYHQKCLGCHEEMGAPTGCQDCHSRNDKGEAFFNAGNYAPKPGNPEHGSGH